MGVFRLLLAFCVISTHTSGIMGVSMMSGEMAVQGLFFGSGFFMALGLGGGEGVDARGV